MTTPPTSPCRSPRRSAPIPANWPAGWPGALTDGRRRRRRRGGRARLRQPAHRGRRPGRRRHQRARPPAPPTGTRLTSHLKINLEFVSANPTGPIHIGGTRWAAVGDALGRLLTTQGAEVTREYYFNDHGAQIDRFARSLVAAAMGEPAPEDGYAGGYINDIAAARARQGARRAEPARRRAAGDVPRDRRRPDVHPHQGSRCTISAPTSTSTPTKTRCTPPAGSTRPSRSCGTTAAIYEKDGATWLRTTEFGDDKDRVVIKSDGNPPMSPAISRTTWTSAQRGFDLCIYMLGADHHGYIARLKAAAAALGDDPDTVEVLIGQMVNLVRDGQPVRMSKRAGTADHPATTWSTPSASTPRPVRADPLLGRTARSTSTWRCWSSGIEREPGLLRAIRARPALGSGPQRRRPGPGQPTPTHLGTARPTTVRAT